MSLPRVTEILEAVGLSDFSRADPASLAAAQARGTAVHAAIEAQIYGYDLPDAPPGVDLSAYLASWNRFVQASGWKTERCEFAVHHDVYRYRGHADLLGWLTGQRTLLDIKTGALGPVAVQLAAYRMAWNRQHPDEPIAAIGALALSPTASSFKEYEIAPAETVWCAAVTVYYAQEGRR